MKCNVSCAPLVCIVPVRIRVQNRSTAESRCIRRPRLLRYSGPNPSVVLCASEWALPHTRVAPSPDVSSSICDSSTTTITTNDNRKHERLGIGFSAVLCAPYRGRIACRDCAHEGTESFVQEEEQEEQHPPQLLQQAVAVTTAETAPGVATPRICCGRQSRHCCTCWTRQSRLVAHWSWVTRA